MAMTIAMLVSAVLAFFARNHVLLFVLSVAFFSPVTSMVAMVFRFTANPKIEEF